jgi:diguanylate cyclase (GGDEF)-like protein
MYVFDFLNYQFIDLKLLENLSLGQLSLLAFVMAAVVIMVNFVIRQDIIEGGFFWALICTFLAFINFEIPEQFTIYFSSGGLILITSVLEYSHSVAFRDELTGLATRRSLNDAFLKLPGQYAIAMVDVDHFKKINDQHGHDLGDQVLRMIASKLSKVGGGGKAYRYGGEEFTIIFPGKNVNEARPHAELLRKMIATTPFYIRSKRRPRKKPDNLASVPRSRKTIPISVSIGVAGRDETHDSPQDVLEAADEALLRAKKAGRNRVRIFGRIHPRG